MSINSYYCYRFYSVQNLKLFKIFYQKNAQLLTKAQAYPFMLQNKQLMNMKNSLLSFILSLTCTYAFTQQTTRPIANDLYLKEWLRVDSLFLNHETKAAKNELNQLSQKAQREGNMSQQIKTLLFQVVKSPLDTPNTEGVVSSVNQLRSVAKEAQSPVKAVLQSVLGELFWHFANEHVDFNKNKKAQTWAADDIRSMSKKQMTQVALDYFIASLTDETTKQLPVSMLDALTLPNIAKEDIARPTIYDFLAHRVLDFSINQMDARNSFEEYVFKPQQASYAPTDIFMKSIFANESHLPMANLMLSTFQNLLRFHQNDTDKTAFLDIERRRFLRLMQYAFRYEQETEYLEGLNTLIEQYGNTPSIVNLVDVLALFYIEKGEKYKSEYNIYQDYATTNLEPKNRFYLRKAYDLCTLFLKKHPNAYGKGLLEGHIFDIKKQSLLLKTEEVVLPHKPILFKLDFRNIDTVYCRWVKVSAAESMKHSFKNNQEKAAFYNRQIPLKTWTQALPYIADFQTHETELMSEGLPIGHYALMVSDNPKFQLIDKNMAYSDIPNPFGTEWGNLCIAQLIVSELAVADIEYGGIIATHRETGKPLANVHFDYFSTKEDLILDKKQAKITNTEGYIACNYHEGDMVFLGNDTLPPPKHSNNYRNEDSKIKVHFFTDRNIYRPAQTIHFKGILVDEKQKRQPKIWKKQKVHVVFSKQYDEDKPIDTLNLITNEFGSFSGTFKAPVGGELGEFQIYAVPFFEDEDKEEDFEDKYDIDEDDLKIKFRIEEYKRPRFEIVFDPQKQTYKLGDTVRVEGRVVALAGSGVDGIEIAYSLSQYVQSSYAKKRTSHYNQSYRGTQQLKSDTILTDKEGRFIIQFLSKINEKDSALLNDFYLNYQYNIRADATDLNGESQRKETIVLVSSTPLKFDLKIPSFLNRKKDMTIPLALAFGNDIKIPLHGSIMIEKLRDKPFYQKRYWREPDTFLYDETTYSKHFPERSYPFKNLKNKDKDTSIIFLKNFNSETEKATILRGSENWQAGEYLFTMTVFDPYLKDSMTKTSNFELVDFEKRDFPKHIDIQVMFSKTSYYVGEKVKMHITSPYTEGYVFVELIRDDLVFKKAWLTLNKGLTAYEYTLKEVDRAGFSYRISMIKNNRVFNDEGNIKVQQEDKKLNIEVITFRNRLTPGDKETWTFRITDKNKKATNAEMVATLYDASLDLLKDNNALFWGKEIYDYPQNRESSLSWFGFDDMSNISLKPTPSKNYFVRLRDSLFSHSPRVFYWFGIEEYGAYEKNLLDYFIGDATAQSSIWRLRGSPYFKNGEYIKPYIEIVNDSTIILDGVTITDFRMVLEKRALMASASQINIKGSRSASNGFYVDGERVFALRGKASGISVTDYEDYADKSLQEVVVTSYSVAKKVRTADDNIPSNIKTRTNLNETVFFFPHIQTDKEGRVEVSFTMNEALTRWRLWAYAHTQDLKTGSLMKTVVTQKDLMVFPNMPRFLREGDEIELTAKISNLKKDSSILRGLAQLMLFDANTMQPIDNQLDIKQKNVEWIAQAGQSTVVKWRIKIPNSETLQALTWRIVAQAGNLSDGEEGIIPILPRRILLTETLPFALNTVDAGNPADGGKGGKFTAYFDNLEKKEVSSTMQPYSWSVDIVTNPIWQLVTALHYGKEYPYECSEQLFSRVYCNALAHKILKENPKIKDFLTQKQTANKEHGAEVDAIRHTLQEESPWLFSSDGFDVKTLSPLFDTTRMALEQQHALEKLVARASYKGGFSWFPDGEPNRFISQHILAGFGHLKKLGVDLNKKTTIESVLNNTIQYLDSQTVVFFRNSNLENIVEKRDTNLLLHYFYARTFYTKQLMSNDLQKAMDTTLLWAKRNWLNLSRYDKTLAALVFNRLGETTMAKQIANYVKNEKEPTFWTRRNYRYWYEMPVETMALMMEMYEEVNQDTASVQSLKTELLSRLEDGHWYSTKATTEAIYALMMLGKQQKSIKNDAILIETPNLILKKEVQTESEKENFIHITLKGNEITKDLNKTTFTNKGEWQLNGSVTLRYTENLDKVAAFSNDTFTTLQKHIFRIRYENGVEKFDSLTSNDPLHIGDRLKVRLRLNVGKKLEYVHLKDTRPAACEPTDVLSDRGYSNHISYYKTTRDVSTNYFFDYLPEGKYDMQYEMTVQQRGQFAGGMASMECMYAPNLGLHTEGVVIVVR
jgi:Bacterial Alpha-2-macroglobulin MG10 domain/Alpha-2-macroglobulin family/MG2 domain/Alpha-2-macroglobulin bait region domain